MKKLVISALSIICALTTTSCSVCTSVSVADMGRSADAILLPLEQPRMCQVNNQWYMCGHKASVERHNAPWVRPEQLTAEKRHPERYTLDSDEMIPMYAPIPETLANSLLKGKYTHSDAISFINRKWVDQLPEGKKKEVQLKTSAPAFFRNMSSHRIMQTEQGSYLIANIGEMSADFSAILAYPLAAVTTILIDTPASFFYSPPVQKPQIAQPEEVE